MDRTWMYNARRTDTYFREELNKFIQVAEKHAKKWEDTVDALPMQSLQEFESIQRPNYNKIACGGEWFC